MKPVIQLETTGCGIAACAVLAGISYLEAKRVANSLGITADDQTLWSTTTHVRRLLSHLGIQASAAEMPFTSWDTLPDLVLLSIKWHMKNGSPFWHWTVFVRDTSRAYVLDSKKSPEKQYQNRFWTYKAEMVYRNPLLN